MVPSELLLLLGLLPLSWASPLSGRGNSTGYVMFDSDAPITLRPQQPSFDAVDLTAALPPAYTTQSTVLAALPPNCAEFVGPGQECTAPAGMTAVSVLFEDCGDEFLVCRCADAEMSLDVVLERFGSVPVGLRRYAGTIVVLSDPEPNGARAYTLFTGDTHFFGLCGSDVWVHELTHAFDFALVTHQTSAPGWQAALDADTCVPDAYSQTNQVEDFAQLGVLMIYAQLHNGNLPPGFSSDCMSNQLAFMHALALYDPGPLFGNSCNIVDGGPPARHSLPPAVLDPSRSFRPLSVGGSASATSLETIASSSSPPILRNNARPTKILDFGASLLVIGTWALLH
ncbi:hypothetical protein C8R46DRAFT_1039050 [Mycena filopes]|nr:hypothetical protein C8R46DRAFT_1039050 [Mycena filopes]